MEELQKLYDVLVRDGYYTNDFETFMSKWDDPEYKQKVYEVTSRDGLYTQDFESFNNKYQKKNQKLSKEDSISVTPEQNVELVSEDTSLGTPTSPINQPETLEGEENTILENVVGKFFLTDFIGDIYRAGKQGFVQGNTADESYDLMFKGSDASPQDIAEFIQSQQELASLGETDEMSSFNKIYEESGGGVLGFLKGLAYNPSVAAQMAAQTVTQMLNPATAGAAGAVVATGAGVGAMGFGVGAIPGAIASLPVAYGATGMALETGMSFAEFLREEVENNGDNFDEAGIQKVLADEDAMFNIRAKSAGRGAVIGLIDRYTMKMGGKIVGKQAIKGASKGKRFATATAVEGVGGGVGEATARLAVGQDMDAREIGFETIGGAGKAPFTYAYSKLKSKPVYKINGGEVDLQTYTDMVNKASDKDFAAMKFEVSNDSDIKDLTQARKNKLKTQNQVIKEVGQDNITNKETLDELVNLETEKQNLGDPQTEGGKKRLAELKKKIKDLQENPLEEEVAIEDEYSNLSTEDKVELQERAVNEIETEMAEQGVEDYDLTDEMINKRASDIFNKEIAALDESIKEETELTEPVLSEEEIEISEEEAKKKIAKTVGSVGNKDVNTRWADWFLGENLDAKSNISIDLLSDKDLRDGMMSNLYHLWKRENNSDISFKDFLNSEITLYRGETIRNKEKGDNVERGFSTYELTEEGASKFGNVSSETVKVKDLYGAVDMVGSEIEVLRKTPISPEIANNAIATYNNRGFDSELYEQYSDKDARIIDDAMLRMNDVKDYEGILSIMSDVLDKKPININKYAIQEPSTETVDVQKPSGDKVEVKKQVENARKALGKVGEGVEIVYHETDESYRKATGEESRDQSSNGEYNPRTKVININGTKAKKNTVAHEVFHALLLRNGITNKQAKAITDRMLKAVKKTASPELLQKIKDHADKYILLDKNNKAVLDNEGNTIPSPLQSEESIAELFGILASEYQQMDAPTQSIVKLWLDKLAKLLGLKPFTDVEVIDLLNVVSAKVEAGQEITKQDVEILKVEEQGGSGQVGTFTFKNRKQEAPSVKDDTRSYAKNIIQKDLQDYRGQNFVTNMYDFTNAGPTNIGAGIVLDLYGGKNYVADMMEKTGTKLGEVSNVAAFNTQAQAEGFIKNAIDGNANLFAPHVGTKEGSWQFQQNIFEQLTEKLLDNNILTNQELIESFNDGLKSKNGQNALNIFNKKYKKTLTNLNEFKDNPKRLVELLDIDNNYSPDLRKILNDKIASNKKVQAALGVKNKIQFAELLEDPMNVGSQKFDIIGLVEFDNTTFETPSRPKKGDADYHPSFAWTVKAKIKTIVQPTNFYQSTEVTDSYTKFNKSGAVVSTRENTKDFKSSNVSSSAGSGPKVATVKSEIKKDAPQSRKQIDLAPNGNPSNLTPEQYKLVRTPAFKNWFGNWETDPENSSKVVDENGEPLPVSHFTNNYFDVFKYKETGFHFGEPSIKEDLSIAKGEQFEREINVFLNIRNPLRVEDSHRFDPPILIQQLIKNDIINDEQFQTLEDLFYDIEENLTEDEYYDSNALVTKQSDALISVLENEGYDGLVYENAFDSQDSKMSYIIDEQSSKIYVRNNGNVFVGDVVLQSESESRSFITFSSNQGNVYVIENNEGTELTSQDNNRIKELLDAGGFVSTINSSKTHSDFDLFTGEQKFTDSYVTFESNQSKLADGTNKTFNPDAPSIRKQMPDGNADGDNVVQFIKDARGQGISNAAIKTILNKRGVAMDVILESFKKASDIANVESQVSENFAEGFDRVMKEIDGVVEKVKNRNTKDSTSPKKLYDASVSYLKGTKLYENATDVQREKMIVDLRKKFNQPIKKSITPQAAIKKASKKLGLDIKEPSKITLTQRQAIASQIKSLNRGAKDGIRSFIKASKAVAKEVSELVKKGKITTNQSSVIIKRFAKVNMLSESSIDSFVDYMARVFANADYANTISIANNKRGTAKENSSKKIGILNSLSGELQRIFSINPRMIPDSVLDNYMELINIFGGKESVLGKLPTLQKTTMLVNDILDTLNQEMSLIPELNKLYNEYEKVLNDDGEVSYAKTIKEMLKEEVITESEFELMKKYKSGIVPAKEKKELSEKEIKELKEDLKKEIDFQIAEYNPSNKDTQLPTRLERDAVKSLIKLSRNDKALDGLSLTDLKNLSKVFGNINNGYFPSVGFKLTENLQSVIDGEINSNAISRATPAKISMVISRIKSLITKKDSIVELVRRNPLFNIDQIFGDYKTKDIFKSLFGQAAEGVANFNSDLNVVQRKVEKAITKVRKSKKINNDGNNFIKSAFEQMAWSIQNEFITNPESNQVNPVHKWLEATIKRIDKGTSQFSFSDAEVLQGILDTYYDADTQEFDNDALYESFNAEEKASIETIREINAGLTEKAVFTKSIIRGDKFTPLNNNIHINVLSATESVDISSGPSFAGKINEMMRPSSRGGNLEGRTGLVSKDGINFNIYDSVLKGSKGTLIDFHLTSPIRTARKTINKSEKNLTKKGRIPSNERLILNAISSAFEESVSNLLINSYTESSFGDAAMQFLKETGYRTMLAGSGRFIAELTSNASYAMVVDPQGFIVGTKVMKSIDSEMGPQIARNLGWENQGRLYADGLSGRMIDSSIINEAAGMKSKGTRSGAKNFLLKYWNKTGQKYVKGVEFMADVMISTPDKLVLRPITFGSFDVKFKEITGKSPDYKKIAANNEAYMNANKSALNAASEYANKKSVFAGATDNAFMGILKGTKKPNQSGLAQAINTFNNFMTRFLIYEYVTARTGIVNMVGRGDLSKKNGAALLAGVTSRMMLYTLIGQYTSYALSSLLDLDDDDEDYTIEDGVFKENKPIDQMKSFQKVLGQSFASTFTSLLLGRDFGNVAKSIINYGVEEFNKENLQFLRDGKYDQFKDSIQYTVSPKKKSMGGSTLGDYVLVLGAPFGPVLKTVDLIIRKITEPVRKTGEARERQLNEIGLRIPLEILGNLGMIPMYKDVRKAVLENIYKDLRKALAEAEDTKRIKEEMLQGFDSESDMKRYDYELWSNTFGPNSPGYDAREAKKKLKAAERKVKKQLKDELHDYTPKVKGKSTGFGRSERKSSGFGRNNKKSSGFGRSNKKSSGFGRRK